MMNEKHVYSSTDDKNRVHEFIVKESSSGVLDIGNAKVRTAIKSLKSYEDDENE